MSFSLSACKLLWHTASTNIAEIEGAAPPLLCSGQVARRNQLCIGMRRPLYYQY